jgi:hypothetical protein
MFRFEDKGLVGVELSGSAHMALATSELGSIALANAKLLDVDEAGELEQIRQGLLVVHELVTKVPKHVVENKPREVRIRVGGECVD